MAQPAASAAMFCAPSTSRSPVVALMSAACSAMREVMRPVVLAGSSKYATSQRSVARYVATRSRRVSFSPA